MGVNLCRLVQGYIFPESKEGMIAYLLDLTQHTNVAKQYLLVTVVSNTSLDHPLQLIGRVEFVFRYAIGDCYPHIVARTSLIRPIDLACLLGMGQVNSHYLDASPSVYQRFQYVKFRWIVSYGLTHFPY